MKYSLGLDIGTTSVGWAVINEDKQRIEDLGVRIFERPENPQNGESLAKPRRDARSARRRLKRRRERLNYLKAFFIGHNLLDEERINDLFKYDAEHTHKDPYLIRSIAIGEKVSNEDLFIALYHIAKRRGYKSSRRPVEEKDKESGKVLSAIKANQPLLAKYNNSVAITLLNDAKFAEHKRNKDNSYDNSFIRADFETEIKSILHAQDWTGDMINELLYANPYNMKMVGKSGLFYQRPFMNDVLINKMRGKCQFEDEPRAPKASYSFDIFRLAQDLAHLEYNDGIKLTPEQIKLCVEEFKKTKDPSYGTIRKVLGHARDEEFHFDYIRGKSNKDQKENEKNKFGGLKFFHAVKTALKEFPNDWHEIENDESLFDGIGEILTFNKDDESLEKAFAEIGISHGAKKRLMAINVSGFCHLSFKAIRKITPYLLSGNTYDKAIEAVYPGQFSEKLSGDKNELPPLSEEQLRQLTNPVVKRAISQTRKVINAVIKKYGAPHQIKIECATELAKNFHDRDKIEKQQKENAEHNTKIKAKLEEFGVTNPNGQQIIKYKLYEQQNGKCLYCGSSLNVSDIFSDDKNAEIDHIVPFSICGNDSINNKTLACVKCNQEKKNHIPYEVWGGNSGRWQTITMLVNDQNISPQKRNRLLCEKAPKEGWNERALNDTRYMSRFMSQYIKKNLKFADSEKGRQKVLTPAGYTTSYLRKIYGVGSKDRERNSCHHAVDACIVATISSGQIKKISDWNKYGELGAKHQTITIENGDGGTYQVTQGDYIALRKMLPPWDNFAQEVRIRSGMSHDAGQIEPLSDFRDKFRQFKTYDEDFLQRIHPLFVSRMPKHSVKGQVHEETLRSPKAKDGGLRLTRMKLDEKAAKSYVKYKDNKNKNWLENSILVESDKTLYRQLKRLLDEKGEEAFNEPVYKNGKIVDKNGRPLSPVRTVKVYEKKPSTSGIYLNNKTQFADNGKTVCLNIYRRRDKTGVYKFFAAPLYAHSINKVSIPILPTPTSRSKEEKAEFVAMRNSDGIIMATSENGFELVAKVFPNDYVKIKYNDRAVEGYYVKYGIAAGQVTLLPHNSANKDATTTCCIGRAIDFRIISVSILGDSYEFE